MAVKMTRWNLLKGRLIRPWSHWRMMQDASLGAPVARPGDDARESRVNVNLANQLLRDFHIAASHPRYDGNGEVLAEKAAERAQSAMAEGYLKATKDGTRTWVPPVGWMADFWIRGLLTTAIRQSMREFRSGDLHEVQMPDEVTEGDQVKRVRDRVRAQLARNWVYSVLLLADRRTALIGLLKTRLPSHRGFKVGQKLGSGDRDKIMQQIPTELLTPGGQLGSFGKTAGQVLFRGGGSDATISGIRKRCEELEQEVDRLFRGGRAVPKGVEKWSQRLQQAFEKPSVDWRALWDEFLLVISAQQVSHNFPEMARVLKLLQDVNDSELLAAAAAEYCGLLFREEPTDAVPAKLLEWLSVEKPLETGRRNANEAPVEESLRLILSLPAVSALRVQVSELKETERGKAEVKMRADFRRGLLDFLFRHLPRRGPARRLWHGLTQGATDQMMIRTLARELPSPSMLPSRVWKRVRRQLLVYRTAIEFAAGPDRPERWLMEYPDDSPPSRIARHRSTVEVSSLYVAVCGVLGEQLPRGLHDAALIRLADETVDAWQRAIGATEDDGAANLIPVDSWSALCQGAEQQHLACRLILQAVLDTIRDDVWSVYAAYDGWRAPYYQWYGSPSSLWAGGLEGRVWLIDKVESDEHR